MSSPSCDAEKLRFSDGEEPFHLLMAMFAHIRIYMRKLQG
jgi:hypothetical protein